MDRHARILVTGATGFVGTHLVQTLSRRVGALRALVRPNSDAGVVDSLGVQKVVGSLDDPVALRQAVEDTDVVFHLAAATRARTPADFEHANVHGTEALLAACLEARRGPGRFVYLSSLAAAGPSYDGPVRPTDTPRPLTTYGATKRSGEVACLAAGGGMEVVVLRAPAVYGPGDRDLLTFFRMAARGIILVPDTNGARLQLIHVHDLVEALLLAGTVPGADGIYHVADRQAYPWSDVARLVARSVGRQARLVPLPRAAVKLAATLTQRAAALAGRSAIFGPEKALELLAPGWECDVARAERDLGFQTRIALPQGLAETAAWYRGHGWI